MNKKIIIGVVVILILIIGGYFVISFFKQPSKESLVENFQKNQQLYDQKQSQGYDLSEIDSLLEEGRQFFDNGNYKQANNKLNQAINLLKKLVQKH